MDAMETIKFINLNKDFLENPKWQRFKAKILNLFTIYIYCLSTAGGCLSATLVLALYFLSGLIFQCTNVNGSAAGQAFQIVEYKARASINAWRAR